MEKLRCGVYHIRAPGAYVTAALLQLEFMPSRAYRGRAARPCHMLTVGSSRPLRRQSHSQIMSTYYVFLWAVEALNVLRILLQIGSTEASHPALWNSLWIVLAFLAWSCWRCPLLCFCSRATCGQGVRCVHSDTH